MCGEGFVASSAPACRTPMQSLKATIRSNSLCYLCFVCVPLPVLLASHAADDPAADQAPLRPRPVRGGRLRAQRRGAGAAGLPEKQTGLGSAKRRNERVRRPLRPRPAADTH